MIWFVGGLVAAVVLCLLGWKDIWPTGDRHDVGGDDHKGKCGAVKPGWRTYTLDSKAYRCTKPKGHGGEHGYAGVFWGGDD